MNKTVRKPFIRLVNDDVQYCISSRPAILLWVIGSNKSLAPYLLNAHMDVVPAERRWRPLNIDPFKPQLIREENVTFLYGRGALDNKNNFMSILEVLHRLDRPPQRGFYVAFSHDKEANSRTSGSVELAKCVNTLLKKDYNGKKLVLVMDEGLMVMNRSMPMVNRPIAL
ncbi:hypothetical protein BIW11_03171 [Tropilaelaps mercedesae]|uniref:Aminoacylase-1-like n=1 Tax=Tropilaelaps mercedesae TaxID=418985 RepID=A0A1V9XRE3_9ACAR|nr:hypothetical protein BIW11_03171 [Tropilaelaps mercedesae]